MASDHHYRFASSLIWYGPKQMEHIEGLPGVLDRKEVRRIMIETVPNLTEDDLIEEEIPANGFHNDLVVFRNADNSAYAHYVLP